jgi:hypothetical protein
MEGSVISFLKAEWKVSDTGSGHWASSFFELVVFRASGSMWTYFLYLLKFL